MEAGRNIGGACNVWCNVWWAAVGPGSFGSSHVLWHTHTCGEASEIKRIDTHAVGFFTALAAYLVSSSQSVQFEYLATAGTAGTVARHSKIAHAQAGAQARSACVPGGARRQCTEMARTVGGRGKAWEPHGPRAGAQRLKGLDGRRRAQRAPARQGDAVAPCLPRRRLGVAVRVHDGVEVQRRDAKPLHDPGGGVVQHRHRLGRRPAARRVFRLRGGVWHAATDGAGLAHVVGPGAAAAVAPVFGLRVNTQVAVVKRPGLITGKRAVTFSKWVFFLISSGGQAPHVCPMGRTCGEPDEIGLTPVGVKLNGSRRVPTR